MEPDLRRERREPRKETWLGVEQIQLPSKNILVFEP